MLDASDDILPAALYYLGLDPNSANDVDLQKSADLKGWQEVTSFTASAGTNLWSHTAGSDSIAYFRLKWQR